MTLLCVPIFVIDAGTAKRDIARAAQAGADMVELRLDDIADVTLAQEMVSASILPLMVTCRPPSEGGRSVMTDEQRVEMLECAAAQYVDLELATLLAHPAAALFSSIIVSSHDFTGRPARLANILLEMNATRAVIHKIVWTARTIRDNLEAFEILQRRLKPTIALCMGEHGLISRVLARKFGAFLTFAALDDASATAPGQLTIEQMKRLYRWDAIAPATRVYGVVASPVMHSMSPAIHNAAFEHVGHDGVYLPLLVNPGYESFKAFMESFLHFSGLDLSGLSVTLPHKENALRYLRETNSQIEPLAERIGAVNTIIIDRSNGEAVLRGINTDYAAILDSITAKLGISRDDLARYRVAVLGAGGTGRTAVAALAHYGATVVIYNRTFDRAAALADEFNGRTGQVVAARWEKLCDSCCQIYINTTSVGMFPNIDQSPLGDSPPKFSAETLVFDTIYNPLSTTLLQQATATGAQTISGIEMFVRQAAAQFESWVGKPAPVEVMHEVIVNRLRHA